MNRSSQIETNGLHLELALRPMRGAPVPGGHSQRWTSKLWPVPAVVLMTVLLVVPSGFTVSFAVATQPQVPLWCALGVAGVVCAVPLLRTGRGAGSGRRGRSWSRSAATAVRGALWFLWAVVVMNGRRGSVWFRWAAVAMVRRLGGYPWAWRVAVVVWLVAVAVWRTAVAVRGSVWFLWVVVTLNLRRAGALACGLLVAVAVVRLVRELTFAGAAPYAYTLVMVLLSALLCAAALTVAWHARHRWWMWLPVIAPCAVAALVSGVAFRLIFQRSADLFGFGGAWSQWLWFLLLPFAAFLWTWFGFVTALLRDGIRAVEADAARARYLSQASGLRFVRRLLTQLRPVVLVVGLVIGVAAARMFDVILIGVPWSLQEWNESATVHWWRLAGDPALGAGPAAAYALPLTAMVGVVAWWLQTGAGEHRMAPVRGVTSEPRSIRKRPGPVRLLGAAVVIAIFWAPVAVLVVAAVYGPYGFRWDAVTGLWNDEVLWHALLSTAWVAGLTTVLVVTAAVPAAHRLAAGRPDRRRTRVAVVCLVVLAVLPVQTYLGPIVRVVEKWGLSGTQAPLILVHTAAGLPIAILVLRAALLAPPGSPAATELHGPAGHAATVRRVISAAWPALGAVAVLELVQVWNDFCVGLLVGGAGGSPWSLLLWGQARQFEENASRLAAGSLVSAVIPVVLVLLTWRRWLVPGLTGGALR
ncbi:carbohydrate ABC transporter permease [Nocardia bovistercoris]|uniref:Carbohydrate ABC transporter permease n=1 Tax=Nocardia bovistercoris TaxID=2785916 RepID=A0A931I7G3_9NOCA|nr:carbohydrate ABC transporter permease [Nocardia bovistercoris]MBH0774805.1 carbohydrate ABC transporter permease [Nocardia bovistercoris]